MRNSKKLVGVRKLLNPISTSLSFLLISFAENIFTCLMETCFVPYKYGNFNICRIEYVKWLNWYYLIYFSFWYSLIYFSFYFGNKWGEAGTFFQPKSPRFSRSSESALSLDSLPYGRVFGKIFEGQAEIANIPNAGRGKSGKHRRNFTDVNRGRKFRRLEEFLPLPGYAWAR